jgi:hypothetical protein
MAHKIFSIVYNIFEEMNELSQYADFLEEFEEINSIVETHAGSNVALAYQDLWTAIYKCKGALWDARDEFELFADAICQGNGGIECPDCPDCPEGIDCPDCPDS